MNLFEEQKTDPEGITCVLKVSQVEKLKRGV